jgi:hypothetical protein
VNHIRLSHEESLWKWNHTVIDEIGACDFLCVPPDDGTLVTKTYVGVIIYIYKQVCAFVGLI